MKDTSLSLSHCTCDRKTFRSTVPLMGGEEMKIPYGQQTCARTEKSTAHFPAWPPDGSKLTAWRRSTSPSSAPCLPRVQLVKTKKILTFSQLRHSENFSGHVYVQTTARYSPTSYIHFCTVNKLLWPKHIWCAPRYTWQCSVELQLHVSKQVSQINWPPTTPACCTS